MSLLLLFEKCNRLFIVVRVPHDLNLFIQCTVAKYDAMCFIRIECKRRLKKIVYEILRSIIYLIVYNNLKFLVSFSYFLNRVCQNSPSRPLMMWCYLKYFLTNLRVSLLSPKEELLSLSKELF